MPKDRKDNKISDAEASFFGDDLSWLEDEDEAKASAKAEPAKEPERLIVAPPEATVPVVPAAQLGRFGDAVQTKGAQRRAPMPTLPPTAAMLEDALPTQTGEPAVPAPSDKKAPAKVPVPVLARTLVLSPAALAAARAGGETPEPAAPRAPAPPAPPASLAPVVPPPVVIAPVLPPVPVVTAPVLPPPAFVAPPPVAPPPVAPPPVAPHQIAPPPVAPPPVAPPPIAPAVLAPPVPAPPPAIAPPAAGVEPVIAAPGSEARGIDAPMIEAAPVAEAVVEVAAVAPAPPVAPPPEPAIEEPGHDFSADDTLSPEPPPALAVKPSLAEASEAVESDFPTQEDATIEVDPPSSEAARLRRLEEEDDSSAEVFGDEFPEAEPLVRTHEPAPARGQDPTLGAEPAFTAPPSTPAQPAWAPREAEAEWAEAAASLVAEAQLTHDAVARGALLYEAGRIYRRRLGDRAAAEDLFRQALGHGFRSSTLLQELGDGAARQQRWAEAVDHLTARAALGSGPSASEPLQQAAVINRQRLDRPDAARDGLAAAVAADAEDYAAWSLYRDLLVDTPARSGDTSPDEARIAVLERLAELGEGRVAADTWWEQGRLLQRLGRIDESRRAFDAARRCEPGHVASLLALESIELTASNEAGLAALYEDEANRAGQADVGYWTLRAARVFAQSRADDDAIRCFSRAIALGALGARREAQGWLLRIGSFDEAERLFRDELEALAPHGAAAASLWLAIARCCAARKDRVAEADAARRALAADPECVPAEAIVALRDRDSLGGAGARAAMQIHGADGAARLVIASEIAGDLANARRGWEALAAARPADAAVADGLARARLAAGDAEGARVLLRAVAERASGVERASLLVRAALYGVAVDPRAVGWLAEAASLRPDDVVAVDGVATSGLAANDARTAIAALLAGADAATGALARTWRVRAAILTWSLGDVDGAARLAQRLQADEPDDPIGTELEAFAVGGGAAAGASIARAVESARKRRAGDAVWSWLHVARLAAGSTRGDEAIGDARRASPLHPAVAFEIELGGFERGDYASLLPYWRQRAVSSSGAERVEALVRVVEIGNDLEELDAVVEAGRTLAATGGTDWPVRAVARVLESVQAWPETDAVLKVSDAPEDVVHRARIAGLRLGRAAEGVALVTPLYDVPDWRLTAGTVGAGLAQRAGDRAAVVRANGAVADAASRAPLRAAHAVWAAGLAELDDKAEAARWWRLALSLRPTSDVAFEGARRVLIALGRTDELTALYAESRPNDALGFAEALEEIGDFGAATDAWKRVGDGLAAALRREIAAGRADRWKDAYEALCTRRDVVLDPETRERIDAKRRWVLAEKLAATDEAWELYRQLHEESPADPEVTEALARIAGARGEVNLSVQFLKELAEHASGPAEAARYQRRVAEVLEQNGDPAGAKQALFDALDHVSDDREALGGLRRIARATEDWAGLVAVLQRESTIEVGESRIERLAEMAAITEDKLSDPKVAIDRWRSVVDEAPTRTDALERLMGLARSEEEWALLVDVGRQLAALREGAERVALLGQIGVVALEHVAWDEGVRLLEEAIATEPVDVAAAARLEQVHRERGDWTGTVRAIAALASATTGVAQATVYLRAARVELEGRHDRQAAGAWYDRVLAADPENEEALKFQAELLFAGDRPGAALVVYERLEPFMVRQGDPEDFDGRIETSAYWFRYAELLREAGRGVEALGRYERALELNPTHLPTLEAVGPIYAQRQDWPAAERIWRQLLQLTGGQGDREKVATLYAELGRVELALGSVEKAQKRFGKALEVQPNHVGALKGLAGLLEQRGEWSTLLNVYNNLIYHSLVPSDVTTAFLAKGRILDVNMGRADKAAQHYESCLSVDPNHVGALLRLAELALRREAWDEAAKWADRGLEGREPGAERASLVLVHAAIAAAKGDVDAVVARLADARGMDDSVVVEPTVDALRAMILSRA